MKLYDGKVLNNNTNTLCPWAGELAGFEPTNEEASCLLQPETMDECMDAFDHYDAEAYEFFCDFLDGDDRADSLIPACLHQIIEHAMHLIIQHRGEEGAYGVIPA